MPELDEFGIPIKKKGQPQVDEFGIEIKKKSGSISGYIGGTVGSSKAPSSASTDQLSNQRKTFSGLNKAPISKSTPFSTGDAQKPTETKPDNSVFNPLNALPKHNVSDLDSQERKEYEARKNAVSTKPQVDLIEQIKIERQDPLKQKKLAEDYIKEDMKQAGHSAVVDQFGLDVPQYFNTRRQEITTELENLKNETVGAKLALRTGQADEISLDARYKINQEKELEKKLVELNKYSNIYNKERAINDVNPSLSLDEKIIQVGKNLRKVNEFDKVKKEEQNAYDGIDNEKPEVKSIRNFNDELAGINALKSKVFEDFQAGIIPEEEAKAQIQLLKEKDNTLDEKYPEAALESIRSLLSEDIAKSRKQANENAPANSGGNLSYYWKNIISAAPDKKEIKESIDKARNSGAKISREQEEQLMKDPDKFALTSALGHFYHGSIVAADQAMNKILGNDKSEREKDFTDASINQMEQPSELPTINEDGKVRMTANEKAGQENPIGWGTLNNVAEVGGTIFNYVMLNKGMGKVADATLGRLAGAEGAEGIGMAKKLSEGQRNLAANVGSSTFLNYHHNKEYAKTLTDDENEQDAYAMARSLITGLAFSELNPNKIISGVSASTEKNIAEKFLEQYKSGKGTLNPDGMKKWFTDAIVNTAKDLGHNVTTIKADQLAGIALDRLTNKEAFQDRDVMDEMVGNLSSDVLALVPFSAIAGYKKTKTDIGIRNAVKLAIADPIKFEQSMMDKVVAGDIKKEDAEQKVSYIKDLVKTTGGADMKSERVKELPENDQFNYAANLAKESNLKAKTKDMTDKVQLDETKREINELTDERKAIINGTHDQYLKTAELYDRVYDKGTHNQTLDAGTKSEGIKYLSEQALTAPNSFKNQTGRDAELTTDLIALNPKEEIKSEIKSWKDKIKPDGTKAETEAIQKHIDLLESGLEKLSPKKVEDTKLSEPLEGRDEQGIPIGKDVPPSTETKIEKVEPSVVGDVVLDKHSFEDVKNPKKPMYEEIAKEFELSEYDPTDTFWQPVQKKATEVMDWLKNSEYTNKYEKELLTKYQEHISPDLKITLDNSQPMNRAGGAFYKPGTDTLTRLVINPKSVGHEGTGATMQGVLLHELTHVLVKKGEGKLYDKLGDLFDIADKYVKDNKKSLVDEFGKELKVTYGLSGINEFVAEAMGNRAFQSIVSRIKYEGESKTVWQKFTDTIKDYFSKLLGTKDDNVLNEVVKSITKHISENNQTKEKPLSKEQPSIKQEVVEPKTEQPIRNEEKVTEDIKQTEKEDIAEKPPVEDSEGAGKEEGDKKGITHAAIGELRKIIDLPEYEGKPVETHEQLISEAQKVIKDNPNAANEVLNKMEKGEKVTNKDNAILAIYKATIDAELSKNPTKELLERATRLSKTLDVAGTEAGKLLESRKLIGKEDTLANFLLDKQSAQGTALTENQIKSEAAKYEELKTAKEALEKQLIAEREQHAKDIAEMGVNKAKAKAKRESKKSSEEYKKERKDTVEAARKALKDIRDNPQASAAPIFRELVAIAPHVKEYVNSLVSEGVDKLDNIVTAVHAEFKDVLDGLTKRDIVDIMAGEYNEKPKEQTRNEKANTSRLLEREAKLLRELERERLQEEKAKSESQKTQSNRRIDELKEKIKEVRRQNKNRETENDAPEDVTAGEIEYNAKLQKRLIEKAQKLNQDIRDKKYLEEKEVPPVFRKSRETQKLEDKVIDLKNKIRHERSKDEYNKRSKLRKGFDKVMEVLGLRRLVQSALDMSVPFRQGATMISPRQIDVWLKGYKANLQSIFSPKRFERTMHEIRNDQMYHDMVKDNVVFNDLSSADPNLHNEDFRKSFIYKIPVISEPLKASNRSADAFLNVARIELYKKLRDNLEKRGLTRESDPKAFKYIGNWVMAMTGRGTMHSALEKPAMNAVLGNTFYGARLMASRFNLLNPVTYFDPRIPKEAKREAMKDMAAFTTTMVTVATALSYITGAKISLNPDDSDFLQLRYGDKVYDISGGLANYVRTGLRIVKAGYTKASGTKYEGQKATDNAGKSVMNFFRNKLSPNTAYGVDAFFGGRYGNEFDATDIARIYPMYTEDFLQAIKDEGGLMATATVLLPNILGIGYGSYASKGQIDKKLDDLLQRNLRSDEMNSEKILNYKEGARPVTFEEFNKFADLRDKKIEADIKVLFETGIGGVAYKDLTPEQLVEETNFIKSNATRESKEELFGKKDKKTHDEKVEDKKLLKERKAKYQNN